MAKDSIFSDEFTNRVMKAANLGSHLPKNLNESKETKKKKVDLNELKSVVRDVLREELQKDPNELDPMAPPADAAAAPEAPMAGGDLPGGEMGADPMVEPGADPMADPMAEPGMEEGGPLNAVRSSIEGIDWASVSDEDVETLIQDIATAKWGESTEVDTEEGSQDLPTSDTETIGTGPEEDPSKKLPM